MLREAVQDLSSPSSSSSLRQEMRRAGAARIEAEPQGWRERLGRLGQRRRWPPIAGLARSAGVCPHGRECLGARRPGSSRMRPDGPRPRDESRGRPGAWKCPGVGLPRRRRGRGLLARVGEAAMNLSSSSPRLATCCMGLRAHKRSEKLAPGSAASGTILSEAEPQQMPAAARSGASARGTRAHPRELATVPATPAPEREAHSGKTSRVPAALAQRAQRADRRLPTASAARPGADGRRRRERVRRAPV